MAGNLKPLIIDGKRACLNCHGPVRHLRWPWLRCEPCTHLHGLWIHHLNGQRLCAAAIIRALRTGALRPAREFACQDCGRPAQCYDHRDYGEPLNVVPLCTRCNIRRGPAKPVSPLIVSALLLAHVGDCAPVAKV